MPAHPASLAFLPRKQRLVAFVVRLFAQVAFLVGSRLQIPLLALVLRELLELGRDHTGNLAKGRFGVFRLDSGTDVDRVQKVGTHVSLGGVGILLLLLLLATSAVRILYGHVGLHLLLVAELVLFGLLDPLLHLLLRESLVLRGQETSTTVLYK